jgi:hypothetical protein
MGRTALGRGAALAGLGGAPDPAGRARSAEVDGERLAQEAWDFIIRCRRADGGYAPSPDPQHAGESDTEFSDLAALTYAAVLARTLGRELPQPGRSVAFLRRHQRPDGRFVNLAGQHEVVVHGSEAYSLCALFPGWAHAPSVLPERVPQ